ncbi:MAG: M20/M25/M40 family metallo-hydrolase [Phycisphaerae bacterium]|nr:M20/M25/M40 family metallo-hydrolase [Phycisphaerae bacterium]
MPGPDQFDIDDRRAEALVMEMMAIPGDSTHESAVAQFVHQRLVEAGAKPKSIVQDSAHHKSRHGGECGNLVFKLAGRGPRRRRARRLLMAHIDTVPLAVGCRPQRAGNRVTSGDRRTALGADDRAGAAAILTIARTLLDGGLPHPPLTFLWCVQEEIGLSGSKQLTSARLGRPALGFNFDGGDPDELTIGATGAIRMTIDVRGIAAHAGTHPERGVSAVTLASLAIADLDRRGWLGLVEKGGRRGTSNIGAVEGGGATNVVTEHVRLRAEARAHAPAFRRRIVTAFEKAFAQAVRRLPNAAGEVGQVDFDIRQDYESFRLRRSDAVVRAAAAALERLGRQPVWRVVNGGLDANMLNAHGIPTVSLGVGQRQIHTTAESLLLDEFRRACRLGLCLALGDDQTQSASDQRPR